MIVFHYKSFLTPGVITAIDDKNATYYKLTIKFPFATRRRVWPGGRRARYGGGAVQPRVNTKWSLHTNRTNKGRDILKIHPGQIKNWKMMNPFWTKDDPEGDQKSQELITELLQLTQ